MRDRLRLLDSTRVVRDDLRVDSVFQRRNDIAAIGVIFRVGGKDHADIERHAQRKAADLDIGFFENIQADRPECAAEGRAVR